MRFDIALFLGIGRYAADTAATLEEARVKAARLTAMHPNGRRPLIYGVTAEGRSGLVTETSMSRKEAPMKCYAKKFNAQRAAKAAGHRPDDVEIVRVKDGYSFASRAARRLRKALRRRSPKQRPGRGAGAAKPPASPRPP